MQNLFQFVLFSLITGYMVAGCGGNNQGLALNDEPTISPRFTLTTDEEQIGTPIPTLDSAELIVETRTPRPTELLETVIAFTGVIVPARCVQAGIEEKGNADYLYENVRHILVSADLTVGVYNATMRSGVSYMGCVNSWELIGGPENADALKSAGFDVISLATNHIKDCGFLSCGNDGFFETIEQFQRVEIKTVGAGDNLTAALEPIILEVHGVRFGFVSLGEINEKVFAGKATPGIAYLTRENLRTAIENAKSQADVVIVLPHSGPEDYPGVTPQQRYWARHAVEFGADLVVITHAHVLQGYHYLDGVPVFYSLGNFVFDQIWARDHQQGAILLVTFVGESISRFEIIPTVVEQDGTVNLPSNEEREEILERLDQLSSDLQSGN